MYKHLQNWMEGDEENNKAFCIHFFLSMRSLALQPFIHMYLFYVWLDIAL